MSAPSGGAGPGAAGGAVVRSGLLRKLKTMKRKFFVLRAETADCSARLEYYESEKKFKAGAAPRRVLPLKTCYNITRRLDLKQRHVIALFTKEEQFCIVADGEDDLHAWLTDILKQHQSEDGSDTLIHPTQHVWQVNVQKKGLGASKNIIGLYNLCLTDKTLTLVKIKSNNNVIGDLNVPERIEFSLRNIRRCGDSECFFYMEVGRQTATGAGELWMHTDDANIAQSMHSTIYHAMSNCREDITPLIRNRSSSTSEDPRTNPPPVRRQTMPSSRGQAGLTTNEKGSCVGSCIKQCVCASTTYSIDESAAAIAPLAPKNANENEPPNNTITNERIIKHHRTVSLPTGCLLFQEPLKIVHERTRSAPLTGDEVDCAIIEKGVKHGSCKTVNGLDLGKKSQWSRRASTGARLNKFSPAHSKNNSSTRNRCDSMPSRTCPPLEPERTPPRLAPAHLDGMTSSHDSLDAAAEWHRTPRIPEEPDYCDMTREGNNTSSQHSRHSSLAAEDGSGYLAMMPTLSASSGSVSGTPSTDPRFSEYQLEPATSHLSGSPRPTRAHSVGSRPGAARHDAGAARHDARARAFSVGARVQPRPPSNSAPHIASDHLMLLDFTPHSSQRSITITPSKPPPKVDEYVDMSPRTTGYMEMRPSEIAASPPRRLLASTPKTPDGYVEMNYGRRADASRPIAIQERRETPLVISQPISQTVPVTVSSVTTPVETLTFTSLVEPSNKPTEIVKNSVATPLGSQTLFPLSLESPMSPPGLRIDKHELQTTDEFDEENVDAEVGSPPAYATLRPGSRPIAAPTKPVTDEDELSRNPTAMKTWAGDGPPPRLHYAALDLDQPPPARPPVNARTYTQIDFLRSEKLKADGD